MPGCPTTAFAEDECRPGFGERTRPRPFFGASTVQSNGGGLTVQHLARAFGGEVSGGQVRCPGPNHSPTDRSLSVKLVDTPDGFVVNSFAGDDLQKCRDCVREKAGLPRLKPNGNGGARHRYSEEEIERPS